MSADPTPTVPDIFLAIDPRAECWRWSDADGQWLFDEPGTDLLIPKPDEDIFIAAATLLFDRGLVNEALFDEIVAARPDQAAKIREVQAYVLSDEDAS